MEFVDKAPGVYKREIFLPEQPKLPTGVPGFVGFVSARKTGVDSGPVALHRNSDFEVGFKGLPDGYLADAVAGFFLNEGARCYVAAVELKADPNNKDSVDALADALRDALVTLAPLSDLDLIAVPDAMMLRIPGTQQVDAEAAQRLQKSALDHCRTQGGRLAILDALPGQDDAGVTRQRIAISDGMSEPIDGALYYPWIRTSERRLVPPCGHIAGIFARSDARVGINKAPANEEIRGALDLERMIDARAQGPLNSAGINCLRAFPGRGLRVWGARTLNRADQWRYVHVRRLFLTLQRWIDLNMAWANFEPNAPQLWVQITRELTSYLTELWNAGALAGSTADEAFYVKCDSETNPPEMLETGQTITEIGLAPSVPAEFVVVRIVHHTAVEPR